MTEGGKASLTVELSSTAASDVTFSWATADGTAETGDYTAQAATSVTISAGATSATLEVQTTGDAVAEAGETFTATISASSLPAGVTLGTDATATVTITDDDTAEVTIADAEATAEGNDITFTVTLDTAVQDGLTVTPSFTDVTATKGTDYTENTAALTFLGTAGETRSFTVSTAEDDDVEDPETFTVSLTVSETSATVTATDTATGTIHQVLVLSPGAGPAVTVADASADEGDAMTFTVTLDQAVSGGLTVTPSFTDGSATKGTDYTENTTALTFTGTAGETKTFTVSTTEDGDEEEDETFTVGLTVSETSVTATDTATGTIVNDDDDGVPTLRIADASASEGDAITFTVTLDQAVSGGLTVTPGFTDVTATKGTDYTANTAALTFAGTADETRSFTVATTEDTDSEPDETFTVSLAVSGPTDTVTATDTATGTITNDDRDGKGATPPERPVVDGDPAVTIADASAAEGDAITFTVTLDKAVSGAFDVTPSFADGTATKGTDYTENTAVLNFAGTANEQKTFTVATTEDSDVEADETFTVSLAVSGTPAVTATDTATGTITNDDVAPAVTIADASAAEGDAITFTVTLDKAVSGGFTVTPSFTDGTATEGADYTANTAALSFTGSAGETQTFTVATTEDTDEEPDETFTVGLTVSGASVTATDTATGTITDDDDDGVPTLRIADASATEGDPITFTVTLDQAVSGGLTVTPDYADVTTTNGTDYTENTDALTFAGTANERKTFTVPPPRTPMSSPTRPSP